MHTSCVRALGCVWVPAVSVLADLAWCGRKKLIWGAKEKGKKSVK